MLSIFAALLGSLAQVLAAYVLVDFLSGLYHLATDRGWNLPGQVQMFQAHHETNTMSGFDWQPSLVGLPAMLAGIWLASPFLLASGALGILAQVPHYYAHRRSSSPAVHAIVRAMQRLGLIITPQHHAAHHRGAFDRNFCIVSGWNNFWLNPLLSWLDRLAP
jgi:hypothetical protein